MSTLKVNGLTYRTIERDVERMFDRFGKINEVFIPKDKYSGKSRGFAFVRFFDKEDARDAFGAQRAGGMWLYQLRHQKHTSWIPCARRA